MPQAERQPPLSECSHCQACTWAALQLTALSLSLCVGNYISLMKSEVTQPGQWPQRPGLTAQAIHPGLRKHIRLTGRCLLFTALSLWTKHCTYFYLQHFEQMRQGGVFLGSLSTRSGLYQSLGVFYQERKKLFFTDCNVWNFLTFTSFFITWQYLCRLADYLLKG